MKIPKLLPHDQRLAKPETVLDRFAAQVSGFADKLGAILVQLPPYITAIARRLEAGRRPVWCVFDNRAAGAALGDALATMDELKPVIA